MNCRICKDPRVEVHENGLCDSCETQDRYDRDADLDAMVGKRVKLLHDVDRFPHFIASADATGTVVDFSGGVWSVRMDEKIEGAEDWDNEIIWSVRDGDDPMRDVEVLP